MLRGLDVQPKILKICGEGRAQIIIWSAHVCAYAFFGAGEEHKSPD